MCSPAKIPDPAAAAFSSLIGGPITRRQITPSLALLEAGSGSPTIVFEAGADSSPTTFAEVFKALAPDHRVVIYNRPSPQSVTAQLDDLLAVLDATGPAVLVGHSWGGLLVQLATWTRPDLVRGLVLLDPSHEVFWIDTVPEPDQPPELAMIMNHLDELADRRARAAWPSVPVVLLTATLGRPPEFTPMVVKVQDQLASECGGRHQVVADSGHYLHVDRPDLVTACVREVLLGEEVT
jgi:pimeloyl-ACP methyl ester carboxylesterase